MKGFMEMETMQGPYRAVIRQDWKKFTEELEDQKPNIVIPMTSRKDTAVHLAVYSGEEEPLRSVLAAAAKESEIDETFWRNNAENTPLHEAVKAGNLAAVKLLVEYNKKDLLAKNIYGETPLFRAARCGHLEIVNYFLEDCDDLFSRYQRNWLNVDNISIIQAAIESNNFEVVLRLIEFDNSLLEMKIVDHKMDSKAVGKTALHVLANMPFAFPSGSSLKFLDSIIHDLLPSKNVYDNDYQASQTYNTKNKKHEDLEAGPSSNPQLNFCHSSWLYFVHCLTCLFWIFIFKGWPHLKDMYEKKLKHNLAITVSKKLAQIDNSWLNTQGTPEKTEIDSTGIIPHSEGEGKDFGISKVQSSSSNTHEGEAPDIIYEDHHETPLLLAAANGIIEIVEQIVEAHPQAIDYVTEMHRNILHVVIAHRQRKVFDWIRKHKVIMTRLVTRIDKLGFTALHHVGVTKFYQGGTHGPALQLQEELKWYERVKREIPALYTMHHNKMKMTAWKYFEKEHDKMLKNGKEWLKNTSESCSAVAVLIATVVFAAAYTVPGGLNSKTGSPILLTEPIYIVFTVMDIIALATALTSVVLFLSILTSSFKMKDFLHTLPLKLSMGFQLLFFSVATTMMAFALTIVLTMKSEEMKWTVSLLYMATFFPVTMFIIIQLPLYVELVKNIWGYRHNISKFLPIGFVALIWELPSKVFIRKLV